MFKFVMTKNSNEIFHRAILSNDIKRTKQILEEAMKDPRFNIDEINDEGLTALQFSCFAGNLDIAKILITYKASYKIRDRDGNTLLHAAALADKPRIVKYLLRIGLKPTIRNDDQHMPIELTDEISIIVILLRAMLDQGYLEEMQEYMLDHPKLKRNIFKELERVKCRENEKKEILKELPYSSHTSPRRRNMNPNRLEKLKTEDQKSRSLSTFSKLSDSMQHLDQLFPRALNDSIDESDSDTSIVRPPSSNDYSYDSTPTLRRHESMSSSSSHGSRSSRGSGANGLCHDANKFHNEPIDYEARHKHTQQYLEDRFPCNVSTRSFESENGRSKQRNYSDGYVSDTSEDKVLGRPSSRSSSISSHSSHVFSDTCSNFDFPQQQRSPEEDPIYANTQSFKPTNLPTINENLYENLPTKNKKVPPPIPPREPHRTKPTHTTFVDSNRQYECTVENYPPYPCSNDRQFGSETDSGIDIEETAGRVFALSLEDQKQEEYERHIKQQHRQHLYERNAQHTTATQNNTNQTFSKPIGIFYSQNISMVSQHQDGAEQTGKFIRPSANNLNPKYRSWNGRTLLESQMSKSELPPYSNHAMRRQKSRDDCDAYTMNRHHEGEQYRYNNTPLQQQHEDYYQRRDTDIPLRQFNFDHQPEIML